MARGGPFPALTPGGGAQMAHFWPNYQEYQAPFRASHFTQLWAGNIPGWAQFRSLEPKARLWEAEKWNFAHSRNFSYAPGPTTTKGYKGRSNSDAIAAEKSFKFRSPACLCLELSVRLVVVHLEYLLSHPRRNTNLGKNHPHHPISRVF